MAILLRDYFFILNSGHRLTGLGSSDTHRLSGTRAGYPRTWLRMPTEEPAKIQPNDLANAVKAGRAIASNGPLAPHHRRRRADRRPGHEHHRLRHDRGHGGRPRLDRRRQGEALGSTASRRWRCRWSRGCARSSISSGSRSSRRETAGSRCKRAASKPLPIAIIGEQQGGSVTPFAITNPIYVDGDGDKLWNPNLMNPDPGPIPVHSGPQTDPNQGNGSGGNGGGFDGNGGGFDGWLPGRTTAAGRRRWTASRRCGRTRRPGSIRSFCIRIETDQSELVSVVNGGPCEVLECAWRWG